MSGTRGRTLSAALAALVLVTAGVLSGAPAQAYAENDLYFGWATVDTGDCHATYSSGIQEVVASATTCFIRDDADNTYFHRQPGGIAAKFEITNKSTGALLAKMEFHPKENELWVYDTRNDGDSLYFGTYRLVPDQGWELALDYVAPVGTSAVIDYKVVKINVPERTRLKFHVSDLPHGAEPVDSDPDLVGIS